MTYTIEVDATKISKDAKLQIPWEHIKKEFTWVAMDKNRKIHAFRDKPTLRYTVWMGVSGGSLNVLNISTSGVDFKNSLVSRPDA